MTDKDEIIDTLVASSFYQEGDECHLDFGIHKIIMGPDILKGGTISLKELTDLFVGEIKRIKRGEKKSVN